MAEQGVVIQSRCLSAFLQACMAAQMSETQVQEVFVAVSQYRSERRPEKSVYSALLTFCTRQAVPERAVDVFVALQEVCESFLNGISFTILRVL